ncbi:hypothetical protein GIB67_020771 [Kingdonia uniflora]|uniref:Uncharacterized protein n=1 Tax=Kingdonia uniflora TaxID=39325 RepID=A0A7J7M7G3_9MAGN|nr:hypothetical protein GIB67_020771 [Kingdonia uniflora]
MQLGATTSNHLPFPFSSKLKSKPHITISSQARLLLTSTTQSVRHHLHQKQMESSSQIRTISCALAETGDNGVPLVSSHNSRRIGEVKRVTKETNVKVRLNLDGSGIPDSDTGIPFLDHMLDGIQRGLDIAIQHIFKGIWVATSSKAMQKYVEDASEAPWDCYHTITKAIQDAEAIEEFKKCNTGAVLLSSFQTVFVTLKLPLAEDVQTFCHNCWVKFEALLQALGDRKGINRFGDFSAPLDEALVHVSLDLSGRPHLSYDLHIPTERVGTYDTQVCLSKIDVILNLLRRSCHPDARDLAIVKFSSYHELDELPAYNASRGIFWNI